MKDSEKRKKNFAVRMNNQRVFVPGYKAFVPVVMAEECPACLVGRVEQAAIRRSPEGP